MVKKAKKVKKVRKRFNFFKKRENVKLNQPQKILGMHV